MKESNEIKALDACALKNPNIFAILFHFLAFMTLSLPAVGVQKAMTTQHKGNVNSWSAGFQSRAGSQGVYLWVIHRANADSLPGTLGLLSPRLCIRPSSCSIKTCFKKREEWFGECLWVLTCRVARCRESIMVGHRGWEHKGEEKKGKSMRCPIGVTMRINQSDRSRWVTGSAVRTITNQ